MLEEIKNINTSNKDIKTFGITIGIVLFIIAVMLLSFNKEGYQILTITAVAFASLGLVMPVILKPIYLIWMVFAVILGWVMTTVILSVVFYFIMTPIGIITRLLGEDYLDLKKLNVESYWNDRDSELEMKQDYEKQF